jgi:hypothetical protein
VQIAEDSVAPWEKMLEHPRSRDHFVQLYETNEGALAQTVGHYLWEGLRRGEGVMIIVTPDHKELFSQHLEDLGANVSALVKHRQLVFQDADETLAHFMVGGIPDWRKFERVVRAAMRKVSPAVGAEGLRAYGEMVGILWKARQFAAAIRLEQLWNKLLEQSNFSLYCAYAIDVFGDELAIGSLDGVLCTHTHLVPSEPDGRLEAALSLAMDEIIGSEAERLKLLIKTNRSPHWAVLPNAEAIVLWLRANLPAQAGEIVKRARDHYGSLAETAA